jgi:cytochrome c oxidase cbb3-type subunit 3
VIAMLRVASLLLVLFLPALASAADSERLCGKDAQPCLKYGVKTFQERCVLCHGSDGLGEGVLPLAIGSSYPKTNLMEPKHGVDAKSLRDVIIKGAGMAKVSPFMPPWGDELTVTQTESVARFVEYLRKEPEAAAKMLRAEGEHVEPSAKLGRAVFAGRCALCHGPEGRGDGKLASVITNPPPFNLTKSRLEDGYLREIITKGGAEMGRSPRMPPWGGDLTSAEIQSVMMHLKTLRETK